MFFQFTLSDRLPDKVCKECVDRLFDAHAIREVCITSEKMLQSQLNEIETLEDNVKFKYETLDQVEEDDPGELDQIEMEYISENDIKEEIIATVVEDIVEIGEVVSENEQQFEDFAEDENQDPIIHVEQCDEGSGDGYGESTVEDEELNTTKTPIEKKKTFQKCCQCRQTLLCTREAMNSHMIQYHSGTRMQNSPKHRDAGAHCRLCWQAFPTASEREIHLQGRTSKKRSAQEYKCELCNCKYTSEMEFYRHQESVHKIVFDCQMCQKTFQTAKQYYTHVHAVHKAGVFVCELCGQSFNRRYMLEDHKNIHNNIRPFVCTVCGSAFARKSVLRSHYRCHTGEKPYSCEHCAKAFAFATDLKRHMVVHTGKYLYECGICNKGFNRKKTAMEHISLCESGVLTKSGSIQRVKNTTSQ